MSLSYALPIAQWLGSRAGTGSVVPITRGPASFALVPDTTRGSAVSRGGGRPRRTTRPLPASEDTRAPRRCGGLPRVARPRCERRGLPDPRRETAKERDGGRRAGRITGPSPPGDARGRRPDASWSALRFAALGRYARSRVSVSSERRARQARSVAWLPRRVATVPGRAAAARGLAGPAGGPRRAPCCGACRP